MYAVSSRRNTRKARTPINITQKAWKKAYVSTIEDSRRPLDSFSDMTNMELVQDNIARPRPPLVRYGTQPSLPVVGRGSFVQDGDRYLMWMLNDSGVGKLYKQKDGEALTLLGGTYDVNSWAQCVQNKGRAYIYNSTDSLSYIDLSDDSVNTYTALATPGAPTVTMNGATSTGFTYYYQITANNEVGESIASTAGSDTTNKPRDNWVENTDFMGLTWSSVVGATSYTVYMGDDPLNCHELYTVTGTTFTDYGTLAANIFKPAPLGNSTEGYVFTHMYVDKKSSQVYGVTADNKLAYSAPGSGDFSPYNGGGFVTIDEDGDTVLNFVTVFRNGKGDPVITTSSRGAAGKGTINHATQATLTAGDQIITYLDIYEANGQSGTYAPRATVKVGDSLEYPTGRDFKSTGTSQNIVNILTTASIAQGIEPDVENINLSALHKAVAVEDRMRVYYALPVGSTENSEIWVHDNSRGGAWILRWTIAAKDMWLYEDNSGNTHHCVLVNNVVLEFTRAGATPHQDDGTPFVSRLAFESLVWDEAGIILGKVRRVYGKLLYPKGSVALNTTGLTRRGAQTATGSDTFTVSVTPTGYDAWVYDMYQYDEDPGVVNTYGKSVAVLEVKPKGLLAQLDWEVTANTAGTDYFVSSIKTKGTALEDLVLKTS